MIKPVYIKEEYNGEIVYNTICVECGKPTTITELEFAYYMRVIGRPPDKPLCGFCGGVDPINEGMWQGSEWWKFPLEDSLFDFSKNPPDKKEQKALPSAATEEDEEEWHYGFYGSNYGRGKTFWQALRELKEFCVG